MSKKTKTIHCGDWHRGWGYGGYNKIGRLSCLGVDPNRPGFFLFEWKGRSQGRHGQVWNRGARLEFSSDGKEIISIEVKGEYPIYEELLESVNNLIKIQ